MASAAKFNERADVMRRSANLILVLAAQALTAGLLATPAVAQTSFPTPQDRIRAPSTVPLQCNASAAACAPPSNANPVPVRVQAGSALLGSISIDQTTPGTTNAVVATGNVASGVTDAGNPIKVGGFASNTAPTAVTVGQRANAWYTLNGGTVVATGGVQSPSDGQANGGFGMRFSTFDGSPGAAFTVPFAFNGTTWDRSRGDANGLVVQPGLSTTFWMYTSGVTPILSNTTTAVTIKAAVASLRNYIDSCQITTTAFGASVPLALRDGAGGTVRFALTVPTAGFLNPVLVNFSPPLQGTVNTLWEIVTTTANTTGTVTANCQGHTGT